MVTSVQWTINNDYLYPCTDNIYIEYEEFQKNDDGNRQLFKKWVINGIYQILFFYLLAII